MGRIEDMFDIELRMSNRPGELARMGQALGGAGVSVEGGGMFLVGDVGVAHFLVDDRQAAVAALETAGLEVAGCRDVLSLRLNQEEPGQLGSLTAAMADAGVNIEVLYSDHDHQLILVVDDASIGRRVRDEWMAARRT
jgi:hypothetical protein